MTVALFAFATIGPNTRRSLDAMLDAATDEQRPTLVKFLAGLTHDEMNMLDIAVAVSSDGTAMTLRRWTYHPARFKDERAYLANF